MRIAITGATGFLGSAIQRVARSHGHDLIILARSPARVPASAGVEVVDWADPASVKLPPHDAVIHLAGENLGSYWTAEKKEKIMESRRQGTRALVDALGRMNESDRPKTLASASAVGYYADRGEDILTEESTPGSGFLVDVCKTWEDEAKRAEEMGMRVALMRIGVVLGPGGGALARFLTPFKLGVGGPLGSGRQWFPWVHVDDVAGLFLYAVEHDSVRGPVNVVAPGIVRGKEFAQTLGRVLHRPAVLPTPMFALRLLLGEFAPHLVESQHILPKKAEEAGYSFEHPDLSGALQDAVK